MSPFKLGAAMLLAVAACRRGPPAPADAGAEVRGGCATALACQTQCERKDAAACARAARLLLEDPRGPSLALAMEQLEKGCALGDGAACIGAAGNRAAKPEARTELRAKAAALLPAECARGLAASCEHLAVLEEARDAGAEAALAAERARTLLSTACAGADLEACHRLGSALLTGRLGPRRPADGERLLDQSCAAGIAGACAELGMAYNFGTVLSPDAVKARRYMQRAGALSAPAAAGLDAGN